MFFLRNALPLLMIALLATACGGGGGGSSSTGNNDGDTDLAAGKDINSRSLSGWQGGTSAIEIEAINNQSNITLAYDDANGQRQYITLDTENDALVHLTVGTVPRFYVADAPANQRCEVSVADDYIVMPYDAGIRVYCQDTLAIPENIEIYTGQWFVAAVLAEGINPDDIRLQVSQGGTPLAVEDNYIAPGIVLARVDGLQGGANLEVYYQNNLQKISSLNVQALPLDLNVEEVVNEFTTNIDAMLLNTAISQQVRYQWSLLLAQFTAEYDTLSPQQQLALAQQLYVLDQQLQALLALDDDLLAKGWSLNRTWHCTSSVIKIAGLSAMLASSATALIAASPAGFLAGALVALWFDQVIFKALNHIGDSTLYSVRQCMNVTPVITNSGYDMILERPAGVANRSTDVISINHLNLVHAQPYFVSIQAERTIPSSLTNAIIALQTVLKPARTYFAEELAFLYDFEFTARYPITSGELSVNGMNIIASELSVTTDSQINVELQFDEAADLPEKPVRFVVDGVVRAEETFIGQSIDMPVNLKGWLSIEPPIALDENIKYEKETEIFIKLPVQFATRIEIIQQPANGVLEATDQFDEYVYKPNNVTLDDQFVYRASNMAGEDDGIIQLNRMNYCEYVTDLAYVCTYRFPQDGFIVEALGQDEYQLSDIEGAYQHIRELKKFDNNGVLLEKHSAGYQYSPGNEYNSSWILQSRHYEFRNAAGEWVDAPSGQVRTMMDGEYVLEKTAYNLLRKTEQTYVKTAIECQDRSDYVNDTLRYYTYSSRTTKVYNNEGVLLDQSFKSAESNRYCLTLAELLGSSPLTPTFVFSPEAAYRFFKP